MLASVERIAKTNVPKFEANWVAKQLSLNVHTATKSISEARRNLHFLKTYMPVKIER